MQTELISQYHNNLLTGNFDINKTRELIGRKYYWLSFKKNVQAYVKGGNICLLSKAIKYKPNNNLHMLPLLIYQ